MLRPSLVPITLVSGSLILGLWLGGVNTVRGHAVAAQATSSLTTPTTAAPVVAPVPAMPPTSTLTVAALPATGQSTAPIATLTDVPGVVAHVYKVEGQIIVVSNVGVTMQQDLTPVTPSNTTTTR